MNFLNPPKILKFFCLFYLAGLAGCESGSKRDATVQGTVTVEGELAKSGAIAFHSSIGAPPAYGTVSSDGTFALRIGQGNPNDLDNSKIPPGDYVATVMIRGPSVRDEQLGPGAPPKAGPRISAAKYSNRETSGLAYSIKPGLNVINIELERASAEELVEETTTEATDASGTVDDSVAEETAVSEEETSEAQPPPGKDVKNSTEESGP
jgi:hypothetical protein